MAFPHFTASAVKRFGQPLGIWLPKHHEKHDGPKAREAKKRAGLSPMHLPAYKIFGHDCTLSFHSDFGISSSGAAGIAGIAPVGHREVVP